MKVSDGMPQPVYDIRNTFIEHSIVINNFVTVVGSQLKHSLCRVFGDSVKYKWQENNNNRLFLMYLLTVILKTGGRQIFWVFPVLLGRFFLILQRNTTGERK